MSGLVDGVNEDIQVKNGQEKYDVKLGIREWQRYPEYKDSGVEWIGEIPKEWEVKKIKHTTYVKGRIGWQGLKSDEFIDEGPFLVTGTDFINGSVNWESCYHVNEERYNEDPYIQLKENDLLITKDGTIGKVALVTGLKTKATLNSGIFLTRPLTGEYYTNFMYWLLNSEVFETFFNYISNGSTIQHLYQNVFVIFSFPLPSLSEQQSIASFLDSETSKIDTLIEKKQRLIELLEEKRSALISHAVTKGLDPDVKMKNSCVEWIGEIPENWKIMRLGYLSQVIDPQPDHRAPSLAIGEGFPYVGIRDVNADGSINVETTRKVEESALIKQESSFKIEKGDIVFCKVGTLGFPRHIKPECRIALSATLVLIKTKSSADSRYLRYVLDSEATYTQVDLLSTGSTRSALGIEQIRRMLICIPSLPEQQLIANFLDRETEKIDTFINKISAQIEKLKEYRTALISAAVTGKIDVREEVA